MEVREYSEALSTGEGGAKSRNTRERILDATAVVLSRKGYAGTRLSDIAEAAEIQAPAIYYYFVSREELIQEAMWVGIARMREHLEHTLDQLPDDTSAMDRILAAVEAHLRYELSTSEYAKATIRNAGQLPEHVRSLQTEEQTKYGGIWRDLFNQAEAAGELQIGVNVEMTRLFVVGALNWAAEWWAPRKGQIDEVVKTGLEFVENAIARDV